MNEQNKDNIIKNKLTSQDGKYYLSLDIKALPTRKKTLIDLEFFKKKLKLIITIIIVLGASSFALTNFFNKNLDEGFEQKNKIVSIEDELKESLLTQLNASLEKNKDVSGAISSIYNNDSINIKFPDMINSTKIKLKEVNFNYNRYRERNNTDYQILKLDSLEFKNKKISEAIIVFTKN